ncbi:IucA/IucC family protein [Paenibacillus alkalitolerans]|uniref:IucA/IucC family protein n=1 Tax=Paenibacillus alkalitolerans TaxID=2799335 RepID=UPI0018F67F54|nr:IucA/IucC family protein [Paenibacillus alkalitolerans]
MKTWHEEASETVLLDLANALLHENVLGIADKGAVTSNVPDIPSLSQYPLEEDELYFHLRLNPGLAVVFRVRRQRFIQSLKISRVPVLSVTESPAGPSVKLLDPVELMQVLGASVSKEEQSAKLPNLEGFLEELRDAVEHTALSYEAAHELCGEGHSSRSSPLHRMERLSSLRDRPFHPTSRAKRGWDSGDYRKYSPEFGCEFGLDWVAVRRRYMIKGPSAEDAASMILDDSECRQLQTAMASLGIDSNDYLAVPVHPWQMQYVLPFVFAEEIERKHVIPIAQGLGKFAATSSVRALAQVHGGRYHIKLPVGIYSLAALRVLPPRYLYNAEKGQELLRQVIDKEPLLRGKLHLCDEKRWWGYHDPEGDPFEDKPGHLACMVREYPSRLTEKQDVRLVAMSALAVMDPAGRVPAFDELAAARFGAHYGKLQVLTLFRDICQLFIETMLVCFRYGIMPEVHGQNVLVIIEKGHAAGLLLRDHDTIRLHLPWLEREGFADPQYVVKPGTPNSLINETPELLLSYFQTLGIQVNLYAIIDVLSRTYSIDESEFWREIQRSIQSCLHNPGLPETVRGVIAHRLLESSSWPTRMLITPLLKRTGTGGGSMPAGAGETGNPLRAAVKA